MAIAKAKLHARVAHQCGGATAIIKNFPNLHRLPKTMERFSFLTKHAMRIMEPDVTLLQRLEAHFTSDPELTAELTQAIEAKGLRVTSNPTAGGSFYTLSGTSGPEIVALQKLIDEPSQTSPLKYSATTIPNSPKPRETDLNGARYYDSEPRQTDLNGARYYNSEPRHTALNGASYYSSKPSGTEAAPPGFWSSRPPGSDKP